MKHWIMLLSLLLGWTTVAVAADTSGEAALAERFAELGQATLRDRAIVPPHWQQCTALLEAAQRLNAREPRFPRLLAEAAMQAGDADAVLAALTSVRKLDPADRVVQAQIIDLHLSRLQTADAKIAYLKDLLGRPALSEDIRAHVATLCARLLVETARPDQATALLAQALRFNPLSPEALRLRWELLPPNVSAFERARLLLARLRSNPAQLDAAADLAKLLSDLGLMQSAAEFYAHSFNIAQRGGGRLMADLVVDYAAALLATDAVESASKLVDQLLNADAANVDAIFLRLLIDRASGNAQAFARSSELAERILRQRLEVAQAPATAPATQAATQPATAPVLAAGAADLAWFFLYFKGDADAAASLLELVRRGEDPASTTLARLEGWSYLVQGRRDEAQVKLSAIAQRDPLAALGLLRLRSQAATTTAGTAPTTQAIDASAARTLLGANRAGLIGAFLWEAFRGLNLQPVMSDLAEQVQKELAAFPRAWLRIVDTPQQFYFVRGEPLSITHAFGEPLLARITIQNTSREFDLTVGPDGVLHPDLWFDAQLRGLAEQPLTGIGYDRIGQQMLLRPGEKISQIVRVDQGPVAGLFAANPNVAIQMFVTVLTNPVGDGRGVALGPAGYRVRFERIFERSGAPMNTDEQRAALLKSLGSGETAARLRAIDLAAAYARLLQNATGATERTFFTRLLEAIGAAAQDSSTPIAAWASYQRALLAPAAERIPLIQKMAEANPWQQRLLALAAAASLAPDIPYDLAAALTKDTDPVVRRYAAALLELRQYPTTAPTTAPTTQEQ